MSSTAAPPDLARLGRGNCVDYDAEVFFPDDAQSEAAREKGIGLAKSICARCSVKVACLDLAVWIGADVGVWGGTMPGERRGLRSRALTP